MLQEYFLDIISSIDASYARTPSLDFLVREQIVIRAITGPPGRAKPSVNGVGRCNARMPNFDPMPHSQPLIDWVQNRCGWLHPGAHQHCQVWSGSDQRWRPQVVVTYTRCVTFFPFFLFFYFSESRPDRTRRSIFTHKRSKDADWRKEVPFRI